MAIYCEEKVNESIEFDEFLETLRSFDDKVFSDKNFEESRLALQKLYNNRSFMTSYFNNFLKDWTAQSQNLYTFQVFMLAREKNFNIRAPIWMPPQNLDSDTAFVYDLPHDHNFDIMTLGYLGSGYETDIYQYDTQLVKGYDKEPVTLYDKQTYRLKPGSVLYMQMNKDVHNQIPPRDLSISLNIMKSTGLSKRQFLFDLNRNCLLKKVDGEVSPSFFKLAAHLGDENTIEIVEELSKVLEGRYERHKEECVASIMFRIEANKIWSSANG